MNKKLKRILKRIGLIALFISILFQSACNDTIKSGPGGLVINEIAANSADDGNDWIELYVTGKNPVYLGDYSLVDDSPNHELAPLPDITLEPGEFIIIQATDTESENGFFYAPFKLGSDDCVTLYYKGFLVADVMDWGADDALSGTSYGRLPDGTGKAQILLPTPNEKNRSAQTSGETSPSDEAPSSDATPNPPLVINEIVADDADGGNDWIELYVTGEDPVYLGDYSLVDDDIKHTPAPLPDITLEPGEFFLIQATDKEPEDGSFYASFKLGSDDCVTLYYMGSTIVDVLDWNTGDAPVGTSYGRIPDGTGEAKTLIPTPGQANRESLSSRLISRVTLLFDQNSILDFDQGNIFDQDILIENNEDMILRCKNSPPFQKASALCNKELKFFEIIVDGWALLTSEVAGKERGQYGNLKV